MKINVTLVKGALTGLTVMAGLVAYSSQAQALTPEGMMVRGGQLYDWYYQITTGDIQTGTHVSMPADAGQTGKKTWRCSACHGFNYAGDLGIGGILGASGKSADEIIAIIKDAKHNYTSDMFTDEDFQSLAMFVSKGAVDISKLSGDVKKGQGYFETICAACHGNDGKKITDMPPVGAVVNKLPDRSLHRIRFSKPGDSMPALSALPLDVSVDVWSYTKTLPQE
ncbi:c-type cytochrome [Magnetovibrio sp.]|uniref:c-type cytochrome n=1 Tax=Magnetovibrio sp. TaxID=2024836 RepID=UPI002F922C32